MRLIVCVVTVQDSCRPRTMMTKVIVYHGGYGCDTGCCGHWVEIDGEYLSSREGFSFDHACDAKTNEERKVWAIEFAKGIVEKKFGKDHAFDLDWDNCRISSGDTCW
jgi:hypothetical protein